MVEELHSTKLKEPEAGIEVTFAYCVFPSEHQTCIRTDNVIEQLNREVCHSASKVRKTADTPPLTTGVFI